MSVQVTVPTEGRFVIDLDWDDAEVLWRVLGNMNHGNMQEYPAIAELGEKMLEAFGRDRAGEGANYRSALQHRQIYVTEWDDSE